MAKAYEELTFSDDFMFCKVLSTDLELCRDILQLILDVKIREVRLSEAQKTVEITSGGRGIRFDVYVEDENNTVFDLEMQRRDYDDLPKRSRYYQGMIDLNLVGRGAYFTDLKRSFVIFVCLADHFKAGLPMYTFENVCLEDPRIRLGDETTKVFLNAASKADNIPPQLKEFFDYLLTQKPAGELTSRIDRDVRSVASNEKWRLEYMTLEMKLREEREEGREEGGTILLEVLKALRLGKSEEFLREKGYSLKMISMAKEYLKENEGLFVSE
ncbi:MAG: Rpn family recombination-promoting nuclease/putative transposase [Lachnospiraceae bacterium]|nr:Rpn family recombination-promoting nuclease/putative transposase [Lachnospiraceae bacterium]